jgi:hypothetical protein
VGFETSRHPSSGLAALCAVIGLGRAGTLPLPIAPLDNPYAQWAEESCRITAEASFYPPGHAISPAYVRVELPVAEQRLREAGRRLAEVLNLTLTQ